MGKRDRERKERIIAGDELPFRNPITRKAVSLLSRRGVINELSKGTTTEQIDRLDQLRGTGNLPSSKLKDAIMKKAPNEMDKAIKKYLKENKPITVDSLLSEVKSTPGFLTMCKNVGIDYSWFENLAKARMASAGIRG